MHTAHEMAAGLEQNWISAGYQSRQDEQEHLEVGRQIVEAYHAAHQQRLVEAVETIATEKTISCDLGRFKLAGRVDRIDRHIDGCLEIIDYKSGRTEITPEEARDSLAMSCYQLIVSKINPGTSVCATIYCLRSGNQASAQLTGEEMERFEQDIITLGEQILDTDYSSLEPVPLHACRICDFLPRCERFWRERERREFGEPDAGHSEHGL